MNKKELYRSIEGIRQDRHLKERIIRATEEKDEITVIKRPIFIPVLIALLIVFNIGVAAKLVIFDKSQIMNEFKPRSSLNGVLPDSTENASDNKSENGEGKEADESGVKNFQKSGTPRRIMIRRMKFRFTFIRNIMKAIKPPEFLTDVLYRLSIITNLNTVE